MSEPEGTVICAGGTGTAEKRLRRSNYAPLEVEILVDEAVSHNKTLHAPLSSHVTHKMKTAIWDEIARKMTAQTAIARTGQDARKKWNDLKCQVKKKAQMFSRERQKTGGGPPPTPLTDLEEKVMSVIPTCQIDGVDGGAETFILEAEGIAEAELIQTVSADSEAGINVVVNHQQDMPEETSTQKYSTPQKVLADAATGNSD